jgi:cyclase
MQRERVSENVYWFQSEVYAQVTAGAVVGPQWAVIIDTLALPDETLAMRAFIEDQLAVPVRYVINTHYHADHSWGSCFFPGATIIAHHLCAELMKEKGHVALENARRQNPIYRQVKMIPPHLMFDEGTVSLKVGKKNLILSPTTGHSPDGISVLVEEDRVLFAGDAIMSLPYFVDGNIDDLTTTIKKISKMGLENIVQGHGDIILRGEIDEAIKEDLSYLTLIRKGVKSAIKKRNLAEALTAVSIESCGKSRVYLGGIAHELHRRNVLVLAQQTAQAEGIQLEMEVESNLEHQE